MSNLYLQMSLGFFIPLFLCLLLVPGILILSRRFNLVDMPEERKIHTRPVPRFGGVAIFFGACSGICFVREGLYALSLYPVLFSSVCLLFLLGVWDDVKNISARLRFIVEIGCAAAVAATGIRLTSLHGIFGLHDLSLSAQYIVTIVIVVGTTNAFNLIDGVDGLAGGLGFLGLLVMTFISFKLAEYPLVIVDLAFAGALLGFLRSNFSPARIFMGDGGSLVLGYFLSASGILLIRNAGAATHLLPASRVAVLVTAILVIPVFDTLRVFAYRIKRGISPFKADKTHIHHLFLVAGLNHRRTSLSLYFFEILLILLAWITPGTTGVSIAIFVMVLLFHLITEVLKINQAMEKWLAVIKQMERNN